MLCRIKHTVGDSSLHIDGEGDAVRDFLGKACGPEEEGADKCKRVGLCDHKSETDSEYRAEPTGREIIRDA